MYCDGTACRRDRDELLFLLRRDMEKQSTKVRYHDGYLVSMTTLIQQKGSMTEATQHSFETIVKYCEEARLAL